MRIAAIRCERDGEVVRCAADVIWEERDRPPNAIVFEVESEDDPGSRLDANPFLAGLAVPALRHGEKRIAIEGSVCPRLRDGVAAAARLLRAWYPNLGPAPSIEPSLGFDAPRPASPGRAALFLSGGVDSLFTLVRNRRDYPPGHPAAMRDAIFVRGLMLPLASTRQRAEDLDRRALAAVSRIAAAAGLTVSTVRTNLAEALDDHEAYARCWSGSFLAAIAHVFSARTTEVSIAATHDLVHGLLPWGSDPILDRAFSTAALTIRHDGVRSSRLDKIREIGGWSAALESLVVCGEGGLAEGWLNCGRCEKCMRTRLGLLASGRLEEAVTFPPVPIDAPSIERLPASAIHSLPNYYWTEIADACREIGRNDLAGAIDARGRREMSALRWHDERGWKGMLRRLDRRWLGGRMLGLSRRVRARVA